jgi:1-pyrroline-5-carboxylate dehydrogenase
MRTTLILTQVLFERNLNGDTLVLYMNKITYATLGSLGDDFHQSFDQAAAQIKSRFGQNHPMFIDGKPKKARAGVFIDLSPSDLRIDLGHFQKGSRTDAQQAVLAARSAYPKWKSTSWQERIALLRKAADVISKKQMEYAALLTLEVGKNRFEAIAEVSETIDLILYYCRQMEENSGYEKPMGGIGTEHTRSVLKPYGVWAVIAPFNFPFALGVGMATGALLGGNTVVFKPASDTPFSGLVIHEIFAEAGLPTGVFNFITGPGGEVGQELLTHPGIDGLIFTGSKEVGMHLIQKFSSHFPRPCITEMGGKNPAIIMPSANLDDSTEGVMRSAFGMGGQKCSACSRLYLHKGIYKQFIELLVQKTRSFKIGDPLKRDTFLGPVINERALRAYQRAAKQAKKEGRILTGGRVLTEDIYSYGHFVEPLIVDRLSKTSSMFRDEFFLPILSVAEITSLEEAVTLSNQSDYGLTAGIFTQNDDEQKYFFENIESGVTYCNRRGGATTGAWPGVQSFGGWKGSGSSGKGGLGPYYVAQFMREQSQTIVTNAGR